MRALGRSSAALVANPLSVVAELRPWGLRIRRQGVTLVLEEAAVKALESDWMEPVEVAGLRDLTET
jgi:hypothetical protein